MKDSSPQRQNPFHMMPCTPVKVPAIRHQMAQWLHPLHEQAGIFLGVQRVVHPAYCQGGDHAAGVDGERELPGRASATQAYQRNGGHQRGTGSGLDGRAR